MNHATNWKPDPYGIHELRFFSADGTPTMLCMDGGKTLLDKPPAVEPPSLSHAENPAPEPPVVSAPEQGPAAPQGHLPPPLASVAILTDKRELASTAVVEPMVHLETGDHVAEQRHQDAHARRRNELVRVRPPAVSVHRDVEPVGRPLKIACGVVLALLVVSAVALLVVHLHPTGGAGPTHLDAASTTTLPARNTNANTTTTVALPTALKPGAEAAAEALVSSWSSGNKTAALTVATPAAVAALFAAPYRSGLAIDRGCSTSFTPIVCTFGPPGGASQNDPIYEVRVSQTAGGWYVSSVRIEN